MKKVILIFAIFLSVILFMEYENTPFTQMNWMFSEFIVLGFYIYLVVKHLHTTSTMWVVLALLWIFQILFMAGNTGNMTKMREHIYIVDICHVGTHILTTLIILSIVFKKKTKLLQAN